VSGNQCWVAVARAREMERRRLEDERANCIARFIERQRLKKQWISLFDIAKQQGLLAGPAGSSEYHKVFEFAVRSLSGSILGGEFERAGRSRVLYLPADMLISGDSYIAPRRWLQRESYRFALDSTAPSLPLDVLGCCWLSREGARQWFERRGYHWPDHFDSIPSGADGMNLVARGDPGLRAMVEKMVRAGPRTVTWKVFCQQVRDACGVSEDTRGYSDKSIERMARAIIGHKTRQ